jgi:AcrR family transcriptional regulator
MAASSRRPYRGATPEERDAARRRRLLDTAREQFGTAGWNGVSITGLCRDAAVTTRHFYALFGGREELFVALYEELVEALLATVAAAAAAAPLEAEARARATFGSIADLYDADPRVARIVLVEVLGVSERVEAHRRAAILRFAEQVEALTSELVEAGALPSRERPGLTALAIVGATAELLVHHAAGEPTASREAIVSELVRLYLLAFS